MNNPIIILNRLNWIDWAKAIAISLVVFGHIPEERGSFLINYITRFHMPLFFFISGYLTKKELFCKSTLEKYYHTLIIPYFCYNIVFYPYWVVRHMVDYPNAGWYDFVKPIIGTFMLQHETAYYESLNGVTWFVSSLLIMKLVLAVCNKYRKGIFIIAFFFVIVAIIYVFNEHYKFIIDLPFVGFTRCFPFFLIGHWCKQKGIVNQSHQKYDWAICIGGFCISILVYMRDLQGLLEYAVSFWIICISAIAGFFCLCKILDRFHFNIIANISIGTIVIMGLHWILIGVTNFSLSKMFHVNGGIVYPWYVAIALTSTFIAILYPIILLFKNKYQFMLGKWRKK